MAEGDKKRMMRAAQRMVHNILEGPPIDDLANLRQAVEEKREVSFVDGSKMRFESLEEIGDFPRLNVTMILPIENITITIGFNEEAKCPKP